MKLFSRRVFLGAACIVCACTGVALGIPLTGPCNTDASNTCKYDCVPSTDGYYYASSDTTQVPYCANDKKYPPCNDSAQNFKCTAIRYDDKNCSMNAKQVDNQKLTCK